MLLALQLLNLLANEGDPISPPVLLANIPNIAKPEDTGTYVINLGVYFSGAVTYAIAPALETGWSFDTDTGELTIDTDDTATFGPYTVTATNPDGDEDSNAFSVYITVPAVGGNSGANIGMYHRRRRRKWR